MKVRDESVYPRALRCPLVKAIRRFSVRPVLPARIAALGDLAINLRWSWHPPLRDLFESIDPARWAAVGQDPVAMLSAVEPDELERLAADPAFVERVDAAQAGPGPLPRRGPLVPAVGPRAGRGRALGDRLLQRRVRHHRRAAAVLRRPRHPRGRPPQGGLRPRRADRRRRPVLQDRLLPPEPDPRRLAAGELPGARPRRAAAVAAARGGRHAGGRHHRRCPAGASCTPTSGAPRSAGCRCCCSTPTCTSNDEAARSVTDRLYGGGGEHRLQQEMLLGMGGVRALRLWSRLTGAPDPRRLPRQRGPRRLPRRRADQRARAAPRR